MRISTLFYTTNKTVVFGEKKLRIKFEKKSKKN